MNCSLPSAAKALPSSSCIPHKPRFHVFTINSKITQQHKSLSKKILIRKDQKPPTINSFLHDKSGLAIQLGALLTLVAEQPALAATKEVINRNSLAWAITGVSNEAELPTVLTAIAGLAFWYFLIMPPIILNWLRTRWFKRKFLEMYFQFMFVFLFFPGILIWAPFLNVRPMPVDPRMKYPWTVLDDSTDSVDSTSNL